MIEVSSNRGFIRIEHPTYLKPHNTERVVQESSAVGDYDDSFEKPGSSFLWVGDRHHLNREEVAELVQFMQGWLETGRLVKTAASR